MKEFKSRNPGSIANLKITGWHLETTQDGVDLDEEDVLQVAIILLKSVGVDCKDIEERKIIRKLISLRRQKNLTQQDVARKIGWTIIQVSELENGIDNDLTIGDLRTYCNILGMSLLVQK